MSTFIQHLHLSCDLTVGALIDIYHVLEVLIECSILLSWILANKVDGLD